MAGHIEKRGPSAWRVTVVLGYDEMTREPIRHRKTIHGTKKDAERYLTAFVRDRDLGRYAEPERTTLGAHIDRWLSTVAAARVRETTFQSYSDLMRVHVKPALGKTHLDRLKPETLQDFYRDLSTAGKSPRTVRYVHAVLHSALKAAVKWGLIQGNPSDFVDLPRLAKAERPVIPPELAARFIEAASKDRWGVLFLFALTSGMRPGEYLALRWPDIDMKTGAVTIRRSLVKPKGGGWYLAEAKTSKSARSLILPAELLPMLRDHRARQDEERMAMGDAYQDHGLVFASITGTPVDRRNMTEAHLKKVLKAAGLPETLTLYALRHSCATLLLSAGTNPKIVAERLGHSTITLTMDVYSHVTPTMQKEAAETLSAALFKPPAKPKRKPQPKPDGARR